MFWRKQRKTDPSLKALQKQLEDLQESIKGINSQKAEYHFHIDRVDIHQPSLDKLSFHLDQIDIEDLSGALNVGNNFGVKIGDKKEERLKEEKLSEEEKVLKTTKDGYSITFKNKEGGE